MMRTALLLLVATLTLAQDDVDFSSYDNHCTACLYNGGSFCSTEDDSTADTFTYALGYGTCTDDSSACDVVATDFTQCGYEQPVDEDGEELPDDDDIEVDDSTDGATDDGSEQAADSATN